MIELLVVIAIIGVLATVTFIAINPARGKARDTRRIADTKVLSQALELYRFDNSGLPYGNGQSGVVLTGGTVLDELVTGGQLARVPQDPNAVGNNRYWYSNRTGANAIGNGDTDRNTYFIRFRTEGPTELGPADFYCVTSAGIVATGTGTDACTQG